MTAAIHRQHAGHWSSRREPTEATDTAYAEPLALPPTKQWKRISAFVWITAFTLCPLIVVSLGAWVVHIARS